MLNFNFPTISNQVIALELANFIPAHDLACDLSTLYFRLGTGVLSVKNFIPQNGVIIVRLVRNYDELMSEYDKADDGFSMELFEREVERKTRKGTCDRKTFLALSEHFFSSI